MEIATSRKGHLPATLAYLKHQAFPHFLKFCWKHWIKLVVISVWLIILLTNRLPADTWLLGYDNMVPELNLSLAFERVWHGIWQDYRGLGVNNSIMDVAELTRLPWVFLLRSLFSARLVRWSWFMLMLLLGCLSTLSLAKILLELVYLDKKHLTSFTKQLGALTAALFYLLNPATIQFFYTPLETFASFYGFAPLIMWAFVKYVRDPRPRFLMLLLLVSFAGSSAFYVQTFFVVLLMTLGALSLGFLFRKNWWRYFKRISLALVTVVIANAFWFLPLLTTLGSNHDVYESKQNVVSTPQVQEMNQTYGAFKQFSLLYGYWFEYLEYKYQEETNNYTPYLNQWHDFWQRSEVKAIGYVLFIISITGYGLAIWQFKGKRMILGLAGVMLLSIIMISAGEGVFGYPFRLLAKIGIFNQIFRVSFTKWSIIAALTYGMGVSLFIVSMAMAMRGGKHGQNAAVLFTIILVFLTSYRLIPVLQNNLFGWQVQTPFPQTYYDLADFMDTQDHTATATILPMPNYWGWLFYDWGYRGSGFLWQMIPQATLDRNFDVWSLKNQNAYQELNLAVERGDSELLKQVTTKYNLRYIIFDENINNVNVNVPEIRAKAILEIQELMSELKPQIIWQQDKVTVYDLASTMDTNVLSVTQDYHQVDSPDNSGLKDIIYDQLGNYVDAGGQDDRSPTNYYPFASFFNEKVEGVRCQNDQCEIADVLAGMEIPTGSQLQLPKVENGDAYIMNGIVQFRSLTGQSPTESIHISFEPTMTLVVNNVTYAVPQLAPLSLEGFQVSSAGAVLDLGDQRAYYLKPGEIINFTIQLTVGEKFVVKVIDLLEFDEYGINNIPRSIVQELEFPASIWNPLLETTTIPLPPSPQLVVHWRATAFSLDFLQRTDFRNCDLRRRGTVSRQNNNGSIFYTVNNFGNLCENYSLKELSGYNNYLMQFEGQNLAGHPLLIYATDASTRRLLMDIVLERGDNEENRIQYYFLPQLKIDGIKQHELYLHVNNKSYGQEARNTLEAMRFYQYPVDYLGSIAVTFPTPPHEETKALTLASWHRNNTNSYVGQLTSANTSNLSSTSAETGSPNALVLKRRFDPGWRARVKKQGRWEDLPHAIWNGWANTWELPSDADSESEVKLEFVPASLFRWGLILLVVESLGINIWWFYRNSRPTTAPPRGLKSIAEAVYCKISKTKPTVLTESPECRRLRQLKGSLKRSFEGRCD